MGDYMMQERDDEVWAGHRNDMANNSNPAYVAFRNARDPVPELRERARAMRLIYTAAPGRLLTDEIAANEIERLRTRVAELERGLT
jgi:hypothetical protein